MIVKFQADFGQMHYLEILSDNLSGKKSEYLIRIPTLVQMLLRTHWYSYENQLDTLKESGISPEFHAKALPKIDSHGNLLRFYSTIFFIQFNKKKTFKNTFYDSPEIEDIYHSFLIENIL